MLFTVFPLTLIYTTISPCENSVAFAFVVGEISFILFTVFPLEEAFTVHFILLPFAIVDFAIGPNVLANARNFILVEITGISATISKHQNTISIFLSIFVVSIILGTVWPSFDAVSVLFVLEPISYISCSVCVLVSSMSM